MKVLHKMQLIMSTLQFPHYVAVNYSLKQAIFGNYLLLFLLITLIWGVNIVNMYKNKNMIKANR